VKNALKSFLAQIESEIKTTQVWNQELRDQGRAAEINELKLHYLDGQWHAITKMLAESQKKAS
jgi:hypothetical protein